MKKKNKALHVWYIDTIDSKIASSIVYEYFNRYVSDVNIYKFHKYDKNDTIDFSILKNFKDIAVFIGLDILYNDMLLHNLIENVICENKVLWIDTYDHQKVINNLSLDLFKDVNFIGSEDRSLSYKTYEFFRNILLENNIIKNEEIPESILSIDAYYRFEQYDSCHIDEHKENFIYGLFTENFTAKNFFRERGKAIKDIANTYLINKIYKSKTIFYIYDEINEVEYKCYACNSHLNIKYFIDSMKNEDILLTYYKDGNKWKYSMTAKNNYIDIKYYTNILTNDEYSFTVKRINDNIIVSEFSTKYCIFDNGNKIIIKPPIIPIFSNKIRIKYDTTD